MIGAYKANYFRKRAQETHDLMLLILVAETMVWREIKTAVGDPPCPRDKLCAVTMGSKALFFGGFGPINESNDDESKEGEAEFGWFNDLYSYDTGWCANEQHI